MIHCLCGVCLATAPELKGFIVVLCLCAAAATAGVVVDSCTWLTELQWAYSQPDVLPTVCKPGFAACVMVLT